MIIEPETKTITVISILNYFFKKIITRKKSRRSNKKK